MTQPGRKPLISGNWKMHLNHFEAIQTVQKLAYLLTKEDHEAVDVSVRLVQIAEFKRKQAAPGLKVTDRAFGTGWRMPIAGRRP